MPYYVILQKFMNSTEPDVPIAEELLTLNVAMLNKDTLPPEADIIYESFLDKAKQGTTSSRLLSLVSFFIRVLLGGCQICGWTFALTCKVSSKDLLNLNRQWKRHSTTSSDT